MEQSHYRIFVCTKKRTPDDPDGCCYRQGALDIYRAFQSEVAAHGLDNRVQVRRSGCLDRCEAGVVALVCQPDKPIFSWLPTKIRVKLRKYLFPNRHLYGNLSVEDVHEIVYSHMIKGQAIKRCQIPLMK